MRPGVDYYALLGVPRDVTPEELKRAYRHLVRQHHPDVAEDQEAAQDRFVAIVEAYRTISDPARRRAYDALRAGTEHVPVTQETHVLRQIDDWFRHAVHRLEQGDLNGAAAQCRKILALDGDHAAAQALLGDVCARRNEWDQALVHYSGAVAAAPRNAGYARKLREAAEAGQAQRRAEDRRREAAERRQRAREALILRHSLAPYTAILLFCWLAALLLWASGSQQSGRFLWLPLSFPLAALAVGGGLAVGLAMGLLRLAEPAEGRRGLGLLAWLLGPLALVSFYLSLATYCVLATVRNRAAAPLTACYLAALMLVAATALCGHAALGPSASWPAALWSGNLILPALLAGYSLGGASLREG